jgi:hypothetical protein
MTTTATLTPSRQLEQLRREYVELVDGVEQARRLAAAARFERRHDAATVLRCAADAIQAKADATYAQITEARQ